MYSNPSVFRDIRGQAIYADLAKYKLQKSTKSKCKLYTY